MISGSSEIVTAFADGEEVADIAEGRRNGVEASRGALSQECLEFENRAAGTKAERCTL